MAKITGLGGVFLPTPNDTKELLQWYKNNLGLDISDFGINFLLPNETTLITFSNKNDDAILNFSVDNLEEFLHELKEKNVEIHQDIENFDFGSFARIKDPFGSIIELAQINKEAYIKMTKKEIADYNKDS